MAKEMNKNVLLIVGAVIIALIIAGIYMSGGGTAPTAQAPQPPDLDAEAAAKVVDESSAVSVNEVDNQLQDVDAAVSGL